MVQQRRATVRIETAGQQPELGAPQVVLEGGTEPMPITLESPPRLPRVKTMRVKTVLRYPDGTVMPPPLPAEPKQAEPRQRGVRFRVSPPPSIRRPR